MSDEAHSELGPRVVIVGAGFGGLRAARSLAGARARVTVVDRENHHCFQPLLYQVASSVLTVADIASPIRAVLAQQRNVQVLLAEAREVDLEAKRVVLDLGSVHYDYLVLAAGAETNYFGHEAWSKAALGLKCIDDALAVRRRVLLAFEAAEREADPVRRQELLTFIVIGGGPTGVELSGAFSELSRTVLAKDFRAIDPRAAEVHLLEAGDRLLPAFDAKLSASAKRQLEELGVRVQLSTRVAEVGPHGVVLEGGTTLRAETVVWAAGVRTVPLARAVSAPRDRQDRLIIGPDLSIPGHPEVFVVGDLAHFEQDGEVLPGLAPVAMQQGHAVALAIRADLAGKPRKPFRYVDKGIMATVGRSRAVVQAKGIHLSGWIAWMAWLLVHVVLLIGFRNRVIVLFSWFWSYLTFQRGARIVTGLHEPPAAKALELPTAHEASPESLRIR